MSIIKLQDDLRQVHKMTMEYLDRHHAIDRDLVGPYAAASPSTGEAIKRLWPNKRDYYMFGEGDVIPTDLAVPAANARQTIK